MLENINEKAYQLGSKRSVIREIFEYAKTRAQEIGAENVFDFSIGNPSVPAPEAVNEAIKRFVEEVPSVELHGYTSAQGKNSRGLVGDKATQKTCRYQNTTRLKYTSR